MIYVSHNNTKINTITTNNKSLVILVFKPNQTKSRMYFRPDLATVSKDNQVTGNHLSASPTLSSENAMEMIFQLVSVICSVPVNLQTLLLPLMRTVSVFLIQKFAGFHLITNNQKVCTEHKSTLHIIAPFNNSESTVERVLTCTSTALME